MNNLKKIIFNESKNLFKNLLDEYDYKMMLVKDEIVSDVLSEMTKYLKDSYKRLEVLGNVAQIVLEEDYDYSEILPEMLVEAIDTINCTYLKSDGYMPDIVVDDYKCIRISKKEREGAIFLYEVLFDEDMTYLIIQNKKDILIYDCHENLIMDNTFNDVKTDAILYTMAFMIGSVFNKDKSADNCKVIDLAAYKIQKGIINK